MRTDGYERAIADAAAGLGLDPGFVAAAARKGAAANANSPARTVSFALDWIPPAAARGNSRANWAAKARAVRELRESGQAHALGFLNEGGGPLEPPYALDIAATLKRAVDGDNLLIGYKGFLDGLQDGGAIADDSNIADWRLRTAKGGEARSEVTISERRL